MTNELRPAVNLSPTQVTQVQTLLQQGGFYRGPLDGQLSGPTRASVRAFQQARNLPATGQVDAVTSAALGLNNSVAARTTGPGASRTATDTSASPLSPQPESSPPAAAPIFIQP